MTRTSDTTDRRVVVSFNGNATASPSGWVNTTRRTQGNNVVACTDLNANNSCGTNEVQPTANASDAFDFPYSPTRDATNFRPAAVTNAFFYANDFHDRAYAPGFNTTGIRRASMANSPFTYNDVRNGNLNGVHAVGELWAATLWDVRRTVGAAAIERIVVQGMKNTPCNPTILQARDALISADASLNGGANRCTIWRAFGARQMGTGASSPNHNSTTVIVLSTAVPAGC
jgi:hypothetical protein